MKNWFEIIIGIYLLGMILYGHYRGAIRMAVSMVAFIATFLIVHIAMPSMTVFPVSVNIRHRFMGGYRKASKMP